MKLTTPLLRVSQDRRNIVDAQTGLVWADYNDFLTILRPPVTKAFYLSISSFHLPYGVEVKFVRSQGQLTNLDNGDITQMKLGWNQWAAHNLLTTGEYWIALDPQPEPPRNQTFRLPVKLIFRAEIEVRANTLDDARAIAESRGVGNWTPLGAHQTDVEIDESLFRLMSRQKHPRIGATYVCSSTSRSQLDGKLVEVVEIKSPRQVGVKDSFGDVYYTNPVNLTYIRG